MSTITLHRVKSPGFGGWAGGLAVMALMLLMAGPVAAQQEEDDAADLPSSVTGEVEIADVDENGEPTATAIYDSDWGLVLVGPGGRGGELLQHIGAWVTAGGRVQEADGDDYDYVIIIESYVIDDDEDE